MTHARGSCPNENHAMRLLILLTDEDDTQFYAALRAPADAVILDPLGKDLAEKCALLRAHRKILGLSLPALSAPESQSGLRAALAQNPDFLLAPEIYGKADLQHWGLRLAAQEAQLGRRDGATRLVARIAPDPAAIFALDGLGGPSRRLIGLVHDETALALALGLRVDDSAAAPLAYARARALLAAACAGIPCFISLGADWRADQAKIYAGENFAGALVGDPDHLAPAQAIFAIRNA